MEAIRLLMEEHRRIEEVLDAMERFTADADAWTEGDRVTIGRYARFLREFADSCHHGKEEDILFSAMEEVGFPRDNGPVGVMLLEHDLGRRFAAILQQAADAGGAWSEEERREILRAARGYVSLLRDHIRKEDGVLYPMAEAHLPREAKERVDEACRRKEEEQQAAGTKAALEALADEITGKAARPVQG